MPHARADVLGKPDFQLPIGVRGPRQLPTRVAELQTRPAAIAQLALSAGSRGAVHGRRGAGLGLTGAPPFGRPPVGRPGLNAHLITSKYPTYLMPDLLKGNLSSRWTTRIDRVWTFPAWFCVGHSCDAGIGTPPPRCAAGSKWQGRQVYATTWHLPVFVMVKIDLAITCHHSAPSRRLP